MPKEDKAQKETIERVMHEFKHGELEGPGGRRIKNPKRAIAIALSEAGASKRQSPAENRARLKRTKTRERQGKTGEARAEGNATKAQLYAEARKRDIPGRSRMDKAELERALHR